MRFRGIRADLGFALWHHHGSRLTSEIGIAHLDESVCLPTNVREAHAHDLLEIVYVVSGSGERVCGADRVRVTAGDACIAAPGTWHGARADAADPYHFFSLCFDAAQHGLRLASQDRVRVSSDGRDLDLELAVPRQRILHRCHGAEDVFRRLIIALDRYELERRGPLLSKALIRALMNQLLVTLAAGVSHEIEPSTAQVPAATLRPAFRGLVAWLPSRLDDPPTLAEMAARAGLSAAHFAQAFKRETGQTPHGLLLELRIEEAARRLRADPSRPIATIAIELGFGSASWFSSAFRRAKGCRPGEWRELARRAS